MRIGSAKGRSPSPALRAVPLPAKTRGGKSPPLPLQGRGTRRSRRRRRGGGPPPQPKAKAGGGALPRKKLTYKDQRDYDLLPDRIHQLEAQIARDEDALHDPDLYARDPARFAELTAEIEKARAERDAAEHRWLELAEKAEALAG